MHESATDTARISTLKSLVLRFIANSPSLKNVSVDKLEYVLAAPAGAGEVISLFGGVTRQRPLVVIAGAEIIDALDSGAWYQACRPAIVTIPSFAEFVLVGPNLQFMDTGLLPLRAEQGYSPAVAAQSTLDTFIDDNEDLLPRIGLVILFQPGMEAHYSNWFADDGEVFCRLLKAGAKIAVSSYDKAEAIIDAQIIKAFGFGVGQIIENQFAYYFDTGAPVDSHFAHSVLCFDGSYPDKSFRPDLESISNMHVQYDGISPIDFLC